MNNIQVNLSCVFLVIILLCLTNCQEENSQQDRDSSVTSSSQTINEDSKPRNEKISDGVPTETSSPRESPILYFADLVEHGQVTIAKDFQKHIRDTPFLLQPIKLFHGRKKSIRHHPMGRGLTNTIAFENLQLAQYPRLIFSIGMFSEGKADFASDGAKFKILLRPDHVEPYLLFEETLTTFEAWQDYVVDLSAYAGKSITLEWTTEALGHNRYDWATWGTPRLIHLSSENTGQPDTKELNSAQRYESIINSYRGIPFTGITNREDQGWFANATITDIRLSDVMIHTKIRIELYVLEYSGIPEETISLEMLNRDNEVLNVSTHNVTGQGQVIIDEYLVENQEKLPHNVRIRLDQESPSIAFIKKPVQFLFQYPNDENRKPHVILISLDTLRADHLGCYGYTKDVSPNIDALAEESCLFTNAYSNANWTLPAHISMFTSLYPSQHQIVLTTWQYPAFDFYSPEWPYYYLPQAFKESQYVTLALTGGGYVDSQYGFNKGIDYHIEDIKELNRTTLNLISRLIEAHQHSPMFLFFHTYEIHDYRDEKPHHRQYVQHGFQGNDIPLLDLMLLHGNHTLDNLRYDKIKCKLLPEAGVQYMKDLYDGAISYTDTQLGMFFDRLKEMGIYDNSWIILTSDHGEGFGEIHNNTRTTSWHHGFRLYDDQIKIPLIVKPPKDFESKGEGICKIDCFVETIDLPPTLLSILGMEQQTQFHGNSLFPLLVSSESQHKNVLFSDDIRHRQFAVISDNYKLIAKARAFMLLIGDFEYELYYLTDDRYEKKNLIAEAKHVPLINELKQLLDEHIQEVLSKSDLSTRSPIPFKTGAEEDNLDPKHIERLKDLGYM